MKMLHVQCVVLGCVGLCCLLQPSLYVCVVLATPMSVVGMVTGDMVKGK